MEIAFPLSRGRRLTRVFLLRSDRDVGGRARLSRHAVQPRIEGTVATDR